ncbi:MAG: endonuclease/exonuclease/phosphatase family protein [Saprospiraceae bacterium]
MITRVTFLSLYFLILSSFTADAQLDVMTATERDGENAWSKRKADVAALINEYHPDILGVQEVFYDQILYLDEALKDYSYVGKASVDGNMVGEYTAVFYDTTKVKCVLNETFWLSDTPKIPSRELGTNNTRTCTYGAFQILNGGSDTLHVYNAHFDHEVPEIRSRNAQVVLTRTVMNGRLLAHKRTIVMGDFNCDIDNRSMRLLQLAMKPGIEQALSILGPSGTFNGFDVNSKLNTAIDHILVRDLKVLEYRHIDDCRPNGLWLSNHLPVMATVN